MSLDSQAKDPRKVRAGAIGARRRWDSQVVRMADLTPAEQRVVRAVLAAMKSPDQAA